MLTKKHFEEVAEIIHHAKTKDLYGLSQAQFIENRLATLYARSAPRFDAGRFHKACGVP